jgi:asparagine synthase (glutamine-hydrolysing)
VPLPPDLQPTPLELAAGTMPGWSEPPPLPAVPCALTPLRALQEALLPALERGRCFVPFSGGRDSSALLAAGVDAARREGLEEPIAITLRFPGRAATDEDAWQEVVVAHLGVREWERVELGDELDILGPLAREVLLRHRLPWPGNGHAFVPLLRAARGGSVVSGTDGDGVLEAWRWSLRRALAPPAVRAARARRRPVALPWLTARARQALARQRPAEPARWDRRTAWYRGLRHVRAVHARLAMLGADEDVDVVHPLADPRFLATLARDGGGRGFAGRSEALPAIFGDLLPARTAARATKAEFSRVFWGPEARRFAREWDGAGADHELVDAAALRREWLAPKPHAQAATMIGACWLAGALPSAP